MLSVKLEEQRCTKCNRLLFKGILGLGFIEAKCSRCGTISLLHSVDNILLGKSDTYILVYDTSGTIIIASNSAMTILGYDKQAILGLPMKQVCSGITNLPPLSNKVDDNALTEWDAYHSQLPTAVKHRTKSGDFVPAIARFYPLLSANGICTMGVFKVTPAEA